MRIFLTCGPSYEPIDEVRRITNFSTGTLGMHLARALAAVGHEVTCFRGVGATTTEPFGDAEVIPFFTNDDLLARLEGIEGREDAGAFLHVAALADFKVLRADDGERKLSSRAGEVTLTLIPAGKVIAQLRGLFPNAKIAGWKYELDGTRAESLAKGAQQIAENRTDLCVVNGAAYGQGFGIVRAGQELVALPDADALVVWFTTWLASEE